MATEEPVVGSVEEEVEAEELADYEVAFFI